MLIANWYRLQPTLNAEQKKIYTIGLEWMDGQIDGWMDGRTDGRMDMAMV